MTILIHTDLLLRFLILTLHEAHSGWPRAAMVEALHDIIVAVSTCRPLSTHVLSLLGTYVRFSLIWLVATVIFSLIPDHLPLRKALPAMPRGFNDHNVLQAKLPIRLQSISLD